VPRSPLYPLNNNNIADAGSDAANEEFGRLPPHEAKKRLAVLLLKMDLNRDERISKGELTTWILNNFQ